MKSDFKKVKPFIKIPGGKFSLLEEINFNLPKDFNKIQTYVEPFLGGGSVFLHMVSNYSKIKNFYLNEFNSDISLMWQVVTLPQENRQQFGEILSSYKVAHHEDKEFYYKLRDKFNSADQFTFIERAAMFFYLNKTCFNGLIRYNSKGHFNSPKGDYKNPPIDDIRALLEVSAIIQGKTNLLWQGDFQPFIEALFKEKKINKKTFVYLDPPYVPKSVTANFTSYNPNNFTDYDQRRLASVLHLLDKNGAKFMLSNSDTPMTRKIFEGFNVVEVMNIRNINCKGSKRGKIQELLIKNYD